MSARPLLAIERVDKRFGESVVLAGVSLEVEEGETVALLGPSGSGKTTLLRIVAGLEAPDAGALELAGREITSLPPAKRNFGMVFQHYALFPHLTVGENVGFGLEARGRPKAERSATVARALAAVDLVGFEGRRVHELSGGQQQRVALARALAPEPELLLLDEPLSNLDPALRERTRRELRAALDRVGITALWVTHEQEEAFDVGDRVAVLNDGRLEQVGTPEELYRAPATRFVAGFVGRPSVVTGRWLGDGRVAPAGGVAGVVWTAEPVGEIAPEAAVEVVFRPEGLRLVAAGTAGGIEGRVVGRRYAGAQTFYTVSLGAAESSPASASAEGAEALEAVVAAAIEVAGEVDGARVGDRVAVVPLAGGPPARVFPRSRGAVG